MIFRDRVQVTKLSGGLFKLRMDVNLVSNVLGELISRPNHVINSAQDL